MKKTAQKKIRTLGIIPARGGSKSIPHKNIALVGGKPLIYYTIDAAKKSKLLDAFIVSTDDEKIAKVSRKLGADVPFLRPADISGDKAVDLSFMQHALKWLEENRGWKPDIILNLRPTGPLRTAQDIDDVIDIMDKTNCDSVRTVSDHEKHNPFKMWYLNESGQRMKPILPTKHFKKVGTDVPRQLLPKVYWQNGLIDATRTKFIKKGYVYGPNIRGHVTATWQAQDIDEPSDLENLAVVMKQMKKKK